MLTTTGGQISYAGNGSTTAFAFSNMFTANADLEVTLTTDSTGVDVTQIITTHYTVAGAGVEAGGTITMVTAPASGQTLTIKRKVAQTQSVDYTANSAFPAASHEAALDRVSMLNQDILKVFLADRGIDDDGLLKFHEKASDPSIPTEGRSVIWQSDGTGSGSDGDLMMRRKTGGNDVILPVVSGKNKYDATADPVSTDDSDSGYGEGSLWVNVSLDKAFICLDDTVASALWGELTKGSITAGSIDSVGAVMETDYNANTVLAATTDNAPLPLTVGASTFVGRKASGNISAMTPAESRTLLNVEDNSTADQSNGEIKTAYEANADTNEFSDAEQTKLAGIETSATADQSNGEIKTAYEANADTNEFSDAEQTKLAGIETSATADQSNAEIKTAYEANADTNEFSNAEQTKLAGIETSADVTDATNVAAAGAAILPVSDATTLVKDPSDATKLMRIDVGAVANSTTRVLTMPDADVDLTVGSGTFNKYVHPDHTGDVTSSADGAQTIAADAVTYAKMQNVTGTDKFLGRDSSGAGVIEEITASAARTILNVEDGATADQSNAEVKTAYEANADTNEFSDAEQTKLAGVEASADVTDTANVNSAAATTVGTVTTGVWNGTDIAVADGGTGSSSASGARTNLGVAIGSNVQAFGAVLDDFNTLGAVASDGQIIVGTGSGAFAYESGATARTSLGLTIGTHVQAWDNDLDDLAALTPTKGKLIVGNGTDWINLSLGDDDDVLTADASETSGTKWAAAGGGGGGNCVLIASIDCDGSATADFTSGITSTYSSYKITYSNITFAGAYPELWMTFSDDAGVSWEAGSSYRYVGYTIRSGSATVAGFVSTGTAAFKLLGTIPETDASNCVSGEVMLYGLSGTTTWKNITACSSFNDNSFTAHMGSTFQGQFKLNTSAITGIRFQNDPGTYETGQFRLYGFTAA